MKHPLLGLLVLGCGSDPLLGMGPEDPLPQRLQTDTTFHLQAALSHAAVQVRLDYGPVVEGLAPLPLANGALVLTTEENLLVVQSLDLQLFDQQISPSLIPPHGLQLTSLRLTAAPTRLPTQWVKDDTQAWAAGPVALKLNWSVLGPHGPLALPEADLEGLSLHLAVHTGPAGALLVDASVTGGGEHWRWAELVRLSDGALETHFREGAPLDLPQSAVLPPRMIDLPPWVPVTTDLEVRNP